MWRFPHNNYIYNGATGQLVRVHEDVVAAAKLAIEQNPNQAIEINGLFSLDRSRVENARPSLAKGKAAPVTIKVVITEQCNLLCSYCPYPTVEGRAHSPFSKGLSKEKIARIIDFLARTVTADTTLSFYGGEPLYRFKDIQLIVDALKHRRPDYAGTMSMTSNMTVFSNKVADFFIAHRIALLASLDGPKWIHDRNRTTFKGTGSFEKAKSNLIALRQRDPSYFSSRVGINCVLTSPDFDAIDDFFREEFADISYIRFAIARNSGVLVVDGAAIRTQLQEWVVRKIKRSTSTTELADSPLVKDFIRNYLVSVIERRSVQEGRKGFTSCTPGSRLIVNGDMTVGVCERTEGLQLGSCNDEDSLDPNSIANEFADMLENRCRSCFAAPACSVCYASVWDGTKLSRKLLDAYCHSFRGLVDKHLEIYTYAREKYAPGEFDKFVDSFVKRNHELFAQD